MDETTFKEIMDKYPRGFLIQLGETLGKIVGLGETTDNTKPRFGEEPMRTIETVVRTKEKQLGLMHIVYEGNGLVMISYRGEHPLFPDGEGWVGLGKYWGGILFPIYFIREDGHRKVDFPGGLINDRFFREVAPSGLDVPVYRPFGDDRPAVTLEGVTATSIAKPIERNPQGM